MKPLDTLFPRIMPRVKGCAVPIAEAAIRTAAIDFCERTRIWRSSDTFTVSESQCEVVAVPYGAALYEIESARFNGMTLEPVSISWLDEHIHNWREKCATVSRWLTQVNPGSVRVIPAACGQLDLSLTLKPAEDAEELPAFLIDGHARTLADGALAEILTIPDKPYYNPDLAMFYSSRFRSEMDRFFNSNIKGQQKAPTRTRPNFF